MTQELVERLVRDEVARTSGRHQIGENAGHVVISLHGIETRGAWQKELSSELSKAHMVTEPLDYGRYIVFRMLLPASRRKMVEWFYAQYTAVRDRNSSARISIVAHSFGTYIVANAMLHYPEIRFERVIFCGSIVLEDYPWGKLIENGQVQHVLNEFGGRDIWAGFVANVCKDAGPSGKTGFLDAHPSLQQRRYPGLRHSDYFKALHYRVTWIPYLKGESLGVIAVEHAPAENMAFRRTQRMALSALTLIMLIAVIWVIFKLAH